MRQLLLEVLREQAGQPAGEWLEKALQATTAPVHANTLLGYHAGASRRMGKQALQLDQDRRARAAELAPGTALDQWGADEAARAVLLLSLAHLAPDEYRELVLQCYELGDSREQESWLRILPLLPDCGRFLATAIDACRTNIIPLFEAIACENPYPGAYFPEGNFNQMVLKALFNFLALERIVGLDSRFNPELSRMCDDYVSEREAAGREVPRDIWLALAPRIGPAGLERVRAYLEHEDPRHRYWAAVGLGHAGDEESRNALATQMNRESDRSVRKAIESSLATLG